MVTRSPASRQSKIDVAGRTAPLEGGHPNDGMLALPFRPNSTQAVRLRVWMPAIAA